ncbi:MAG TPA: putative toxin-antitoxin system toxin component, PIN family [Dehalococcoidia bacterium]|nr:putative toxin-antitoxin system toxin component, PIN family [Dehalococcoidia bacterium]
MSERSSGEELLRTVVDTNLFVSGLIRTRTPPNELLRAWVLQAFSLVTSAEIRAEVADVIQRPKFARYQFDARLIADILQALDMSEIVEPLAGVPIHCRDPKDDLVLASALSSGADYIVTGDKDLLVLDGEPALGELRIVTPEQFLAILRPELPRWPRPAR